MLNYDWTTNLSPLNGVPMYNYPTSRDLPDEFHPRNSYTDKLLSLVKQLKENFTQSHLSMLISPTKEQLADVEKMGELHAKYLMNLFCKDSLFSEDEYYRMIEKVRSYCDVVTDTDLEKYDSQYKTIDRPLVSEYLYDDDFFAYWRVAGNNPLAIKGVVEIPGKFPITDEIYQKVMGDDDTLTDALSEKRIYMIDYETLDGATAEDGVEKPESDSSSKSVIGYSYMAIAMFAVQKGTGKLKTVAIQCGQSSSDDNPLFSPSDNDTYRWGWQMAKMVVHAADKAEHQLCHHLGVTHLVSEAFALATIRNFTTDHPVYRLLISHIEGTNRINHNAILALLGPQKFVDNLIAAELGTLANKTIEMRLSFDFYENFLPRDLENRNVSDTTAFPDYPYRDDGLLLWNAIRNWVGKYISLIYPGDLQLNSDNELQSWMQDIVDNGKIKGFRVVSTRDDLSDVLTMIIFTASVQHAALNFPQKSHMMYAPAMVGSLTEKKPVNLAGNTKAHWISMLPGTVRAAAKIQIYTLLAGVYNGYLGEYVDKNGNEIFNQSDDEFIYSALVEFRDELSAISAKIKSRNEKRYHPYETLIPANIPASVNI
ncbi:arachidonate 15-lipoxygenase [Kosakonia sp. AG348]|nr:arachidonate 15-lipoxygenase [Kosakonia sp. AG348]